MEIKTLLAHALPEMANRPTAKFIDRDNGVIKTCKTFEWDVSQDLETTLEDMSSSIIISLT